MEQIEQVTARDIDAEGIRWGRPAANPVDLSEVELCKQFFGMCTRKKTPEPSSYRLKHMIQAWAGSYISNGAAIRAAVECGLTLKTWAGDINCLIGVSRPSVARLHPDYKRLLQDKAYDRRLSRRV